MGLLSKIVKIYNINVGIHAFMTVIQKRIYPCLFSNSSRYKVDSEGLRVGWIDLRVKAGLVTIRKVGSDQHFADIIDFC